MVSIRDVAQACGVSPMTVSYVINDRTDRVSAETRERVLRAIRELGYRPAAPRRKHRTHTGFTVGLVTGTKMHSLRTPGYSGDLTQGVFEATETHGCHLTLFHQSLFHHHDFAWSLRAYCDGYCDGLIVMAPFIGNPMVPALLERGFPTMVVGDSDPESGADFVDLNNETTGRQATSYLIGHGHRRLVFLHGHEFIRSSEQRRLAFRATAIEAGLPEEDRLELMISPTHPETFGPLRRLLGLPPDQRPEALFGWNDDAALWAFHEATRIGLRIPDDLSIIGVDDTQEAAACGLTTFSQPLREMADQAVTTLLRRIQGEVLPPQHRLRSGTFIERSSVRV
jgi:LacI family transcriptional regulator